MTNQKKSSLKKCVVSVPGKVMLCGEYAVLRGGHALAVTVDQRLNACVDLLETTNTWLIRSNLWDEERSIHDLRLPQTDPLLRAVQFAAKKIGASGGCVTITSDLDVASGIGSSSALRLAVCGAFELLSQKQTPLHAMRMAAKHARDLQVELQGSASGYDITTQLHGGLIESHFDPEATEWQPRFFRHKLLNLSQWCHVFVGGRGAPTAQTIQTTSVWLDNGLRMDRLYEASEQLVDALLNHLKFPSQRSFLYCVETIHNHRQIFAQSPAFPVNLASHLDTVPGLDRTWSWKTTGAGGEDAVLVFAAKQQLAPIQEKLASLGWSLAPFRFSPEGLKIELDQVSDFVPTPETDVPFAVQDSDL